MRKLLVAISFLILFATPSLFAQKLMIGERAPDVKVGEWIDGRSPSEGKSIFVTFFNSSNPQSVKSLSTINSLITKYGNKINFVVISNEPKDKVVANIKNTGGNFYIGIDESGKIFNAFDIRFVPFSVFIDSRGRVAWMGNVSTLSEDTIQDVFK